MITNSLPSASVVDFLVPILSIVKLLVNTSDYDNLTSLAREYDAILDTASLIVTGCEVHKAIQHYYRLHSCITC